MEKIKKILPTFNTDLDNGPVEEKPKLSDAEVSRQLLELLRTGSAKDLAQAILPHENSGCFFSDVSEENRSSDGSLVTSFQGSVYELNPNDYANSTLGLDNAKQYWGKLTVVRTQKQNEINWEVQVERNTSALLLHGILMRFIYQLDRVRSLAGSGVTATPPAENKATFDKDYTETITISVPVTGADQ